MLTCKQVSKTLAENNYNDLSLPKKFMLKLHVALCFVCGKFNRQVMESQDMCCHYKEHDEALECSRPKMADEQKEKLKELLSKEQTSTEN